MTTTTTSNRSAEVHRRRSYNRLSSVMTPIENSAQWRELLAKSKSEHTYEDVPDEKSAELSSVVTPIENSTQWKAAMAGKSVETLRKDSRRRRRRRADELVSVLTPVENLVQWRSAMAESPAEKNLEDGSPDMADGAVDLSFKEWLHGTAK